MITRDGGEGEPDWGPAAVALTDRGYAVLPLVMPTTDWTLLRDEAERLLASGAFTAARVGRGHGVRDGVRTEAATRGSSTCWLDASMPAGEAYMAFMDGLRLALNRQLFLGLETFEAHYAHYPAGASYGTHVDRHLHSDARVVSAVFYLNADWPVKAGGELVLYDAHDGAGAGGDGDGQDDSPRLTIAPEGGTLVLFMSDGMPHEALKATRERWSIAGWFRRRA